MSKYRDILEKYWGYPNFRPLQEDIIRSVADDHKDTLGLLPTGGGKSILFQVPTLSKKGLCVVITPLIALMKDQVENLQKQGIKAQAIYSGMSKHEIDLALNNAVYGAFKFLYVSPERLSTEIFLTRLPDMNVNLVAIDESHCISQWGYDFRPSYLQISKIRKYIPDVPFLALTATATPEVVVDIQQKLEFKTTNVFKKSFERTNLIYLVREVDDKKAYLLKIINRSKGSGIIYVRSRKKTKDIAFFLQENKISADYYHAGIDHKLKDYKQAQWKKGNTRIIVATNAFGMGIDKPDVRVVIHIDIPDSIEAYFQEAGRAGRDEKKSYAVLLYNKLDVTNLKKRITTDFPPIENIKKIYNALGNYFQIPVGTGQGMSLDFKLNDFVKTFKFSILEVFNSLKLLQLEGYIESTEELRNKSKVNFIIGRNDLYKFQVANLKFDAFIKLLLRSYTGVFSTYVSIDEEYLAEKTNSKIDVIYTYLQNLDNANIIKYIPQRKTPFIIYTVERLEDKNLRFTKENYQKRKERLAKKIEAILHYATNENECRSKMLLSYFGDKKAKKCGECDICKKTQERFLRKKDFDIIQKKIEKILKNKEIGIKELIDNINHNEKKVLNTLNWLLEHDKIIIVDGNKYRWNDKW